MLIILALVLALSLTTPALASEKPTAGEGGTQLVSMLTSRPWLHR